MNATQLPANGNGVNHCWSQIGTMGDRSCPELKTAVHCRNCSVFTTAGRGLLERAAPAGYRDEWAQQLASDKQQERKGSLGLVIFRLGQEWLSLPPAVFVEFTEVRAPRRLPFRKSPVFRGLVNVRGELQLCVSLHRLLGIAEDTGSASGTASVLSQRMAVVEKDGERWVFCVDEAAGLIRCMPDALRPAPVTVARAEHPHVRNVVAWESKQVGCLEEELVFFQLRESAR